MEFDSQVIGTGDVIRKEVYWVLVVKGKREGDFNWALFKRRLRKGG